MTTQLLVNFGDELTCSYTGKKFIAAQDGITTNYARTCDGKITGWKDEHVLMSVYYQNATMVYAKDKVAGAKWYGRKCKDDNGSCIVMKRAKV